MTSKSEISDVSVPIPDKLYFKIGEVADIVGLKSYVLRYWETEFPELAPPKSRGKQRLYRRKDIERILEIKQLLYKEKFTIEGARKWLGAKHLRELPADSSPAPLAHPENKTPHHNVLLELKSTLESLLQRLPHK